MPLRVFPSQCWPLAGHIDETDVHSSVPDVDDIVATTRALVDHLPRVRPRDRRAHTVGDGGGNSGEVAQIGHVEVAVEYTDNVVTFDDPGETGRVDDVFLIAAKDDLTWWMMKGQEKVHLR